MQDVVRPVSFCLSQGVCPRKLLECLRMPRLDWRSWTPCRREKELPANFVLWWSSYTSAPPGWRREISHFSQPFGLCWRYLYTTWNPWNKIAGYSFLTDKGNLFASKLSRQAPCASTAVFRTNCKRGWSRTGATVQRSIQAKVHFLTLSRTGCSNPQDSTHSTEANSNWPRMRRE